MTRPDFSGPDISSRVADPWEPWRFVVLLGFLSVICLNPAILQGASNLEKLTEGSSLNQTLWIALLLLSFLTMQDGWPRVRFQLTPSLFLALFWMLLTVWPALVPDISIRRYALTVIVIAVTILCVGSPRDDSALLKAIVIVAIFEIALKYAFVFGMPSIGIHGADKEAQLNGLWRGHYAHKNLAAAICVMQIFAFIAMRRRIPFFYLSILLSLNLVFLLYAGSKTSIGLMGIAIAMAWIISRTRGLVVAALTVGGVLVVINMLTVLSVSSTTMQQLSRDIVGDITFTGRNDIWRFLIDYISIYPWTGSGFQSFWLVGPISPAMQDGRNWLATAGHGHQGYLDIAAAVGIPGLALACIVVIVRPISDIAHVRSRHDLLFQMYLMFWIFGLLHNATESSLFDRGNPLWIFILIGICGIRRAVWRESRSGLMPAPVRAFPSQPMKRRAYS